MEQVDKKGQIKIISDGTAYGTRIEVDGVPLKLVQRIYWSIDMAEPGLA